jgi:hypothetical protein
MFDNLTVDGILGLIGFLIFIVLFFTVLFFAIKFAVKVRQLDKDLRQMTLDAAIISLEFNKLLQEKQARPLQESEGFVKFISESRDWAFEYIEDVQQALVAYDIALSMDDAKVRNDAYNKLISFLPNDDVVN